MSQVIVRRTSRVTPTLLGPAVAGLALGTALGFVLGEWLGPRAERGIGGPSRRKGAEQHPLSMAELVLEALAALASNAEIAALDLEVIPVSRQVIELRGWVATRALRTRAARLVAARIGADSVINRVLVHGEDDAVPAPLDALSA